MKEKYNWHTCVCTLHSPSTSLNRHERTQHPQTQPFAAIIWRDETDFGEVRCSGAVLSPVLISFHFVLFCFVFFIFVWIAGLNHRFKIKRHCLINNNVILMIQLSWCDYSHTFSVCRFQYCIKYIRYDEGGRVDAREMWMTCGVAGWVVLREGGGRRVWINTPKIEQGSNTLSALQHKWILSRRRRRWWQCGWLFFEVFLLLLLSP